MSRSNFDDVGDFHQKFGLRNVTHNGAGLNKEAVTLELTRFRMNFMMEELQEFAAACGFIWQEGSFVYCPDPNWNGIDHEKGFDSLLDLAYVVFGSAQVMGYPWQEGWDEVQRANITKERCGIDHKFEAQGRNKDKCSYRDINSGICGEPRVKHSVRGSQYDVIKPEGWQPPNIKGVLKQYGFDFEK